MLEQEVLTDDPDYLRAIVETVIQEILETKMIQHIGIAPYQHNFLALWYVSCWSTIEVTPGITPTLIGY